MNLTQAEAIASLYSELLDSIDRSRIEMPAKTYRGTFTVDDIQDITLEDGQVKVSWSKYAGCGDYETDETYQSLHSLFD